MQTLLTTHALTPYFTRIIAADEGFPKKPAPDAVMYLLNTYAIAPTEALMIGDRDLDISWSGKEPSVVPLIQLHAPSRRRA